MLSRPVMDGRPVTAVAAATGLVAATTSAAASASQAVHGVVPPCRATLVHKAASRRPRSRLRTRSLPCITTRRIGVADRFSTQSISG